MNFLNGFGEMEASYWISWSSRVIKKRGNTYNFNTFFACGLGDLMFNEATDRLSLRRMRQNE